MLEIINKYDKMIIDDMEDNMEEKKMMTLTPMSKL